jgi:hypothetical protein
MNIARALVTQMGAKLEIGTAHRGAEFTLKISIDAE